MSQLLQPIVQHYQALLQNSAESSEEGAGLRRLLASLKLTEAVERKRALVQSHPQTPLQLAVIGPTQAGKSTLVNLLLGLADDEANAVSSARAGFTVHCQGFACEGPVGDWLQEFFSGYVQQDQSSLQREITDEYACSDVSGRIPQLVQQQLQDAVVWDTPDFDSVASAGYLNPLLQTIALADLLVMVVSKEKYADKSVWDMLELLALLQKPTIIVMNKTPPAVRDELAASVESKFHVLLKNQLGSMPAPRIFFVDEAVVPQKTLAESDDVVQLRQAAVLSLKRPSTSDIERGIKSLVHEYWPQWMSPAVAQLGHLQAFQAMVDGSAEDLINRYRTEFLENTRHKETFQLAIAELLLLLEVPGVAEPLIKIRNMVTWPVRRILGAAAQTHKPAGQIEDKRSDERRLLEALFDHQMTQLQEHIVRQSEDDGESDNWWQLRVDELRARTAAIEKGYYNELDNYEALLKVEAERAARSLYTKLEEQPKLLNSLRAARVSADAAAVVLAVKSGGLGAVDLVIAPAMLSLTTMLTESALGQYMEKVEGDLKKYQHKAISSLVRRKYSMKIKSIGGSSSTLLSADELAGLAQRYGVESDGVANG